MIYRIILSLRHFLFDKGWKKSYKADVPTLCVGNITVGGTGKTPHTEMILRMLLQSDDWAYSDIAVLSRTGRIHPDSNYCFGEGGAGTYSDGKLYTRSTKRGNVRDVLERFVEHGADPDILLDAHAHIGTDRLPEIVKNIR